MLRSGFAKLACVALVCIGVALRLWWIDEIEPAPTHDARWYVARAKQFAGGDGVSVSDRPTAYRPVGYPVLLGTTYAAAGVDESAHRYLNVALAAITLICLYLAAHRLTRSQVAAASATLLYGAYPADIAYTSLAVSEPLFNACMVGAVVAWSIPRARIGVAVCAALLFAATMTRASGILLPLLIGCLAPLSAASDLRARATRIAVLLGLFTALLVPWCIRNAYAFGGFVPIANNGGVNLYIGNNPLATGGYRFDRAVLAQLPADFDSGWLGSGGPKEYEVDRRLNRLAREYILEHPRETLALVPAKLRFLFASDHTAFEWARSRGFQPSPSFDRAYEVNRFYYAGLWLLAAAATAAFLLRERSRWQQVAAIGLATAIAVLVGVGVTWVLAFAALSALALVRDTTEPLRVPWLGYATLIGFTGLQLVYFGDARFHHAMMPWVCMVAGSLFALLALRIESVLRFARGRSFAKTATE